MQVIDLTQPLGPGTVMWPGSPAPVFEVRQRHEEHGAFSRVASLFEHSGTHLDAPAHFVPGAATVDQIAVERLVCPLAVIDVRDRTAEDRDYALSVADIERDEAAHGVIVPGAAVAVHTGWGARCAEPANYLGSDDSGGLHFPGIGLKAAEWLVGRRGVCGLGIDTAGIDRGIETAFGVHAEVTLPHGVWHLEGLVNLELVPARGATVFVGAIPFTGGSGAPARVIAVVFDSDRTGPATLHPVYRVTTFIPPENVDSLLEGVAREAPLTYGRYDRCAWWSPVGVEQFRPLPGATPTVGEVGQLTRVPAVRLEFAIPRDAALLERVLNHGVLPNHPWHEPAIFVDESSASASEPR